MRKRKALFAEGCQFCKLSVPALGLSQVWPFAGSQKQLTSKWSEDRG